MGLPLTNRLLGVVRSSYSARHVAWSRVIVGVAALLRWAVAIPYFQQLADPSGFRVPYADWIPELSGAWVLLVGGTWVLSAALLTVGLWTRLSGAALFLSLGSYLFLDQQSFMNHLYLLWLVVGLLTLTDPGSALSIDACRGRRPEVVTGWPIWLMKAQVSLVFGFTVLAKLNLDFLGGSVLYSQLRGGFVEFPDSLRSVAVLSLLSVVVVILETWLAFALWMRQRRHLAVLLAFSFHGFVLILMSQFWNLLVFALVMASVYRLFLIDPVGAVVSASARASLSGADGETHR